MQCKQFLLDLLHQCDVVVIQLCLVAFQIAVVAELSEVNISTRKPFCVDKSFLILLAVVDGLKLSV